MVSKLQKHPLFRCNSCSFFLFSVFKDCFNLYDRDRDGKVEKEELTKIMRALGHCVTHIEIQKMMKEHGMSNSRLYC